MMSRMTSEICTGSLNATVNGTIVSIEEKRPWQTLWRKTRVLKLEINDSATSLKRLTVFDNGKQFPDARIGLVLSVDVAHATEREQYFFGTQPTKVVAVC